MSTEILDPYSILAEAIEAVVTDEFDDESYLVVRHDSLHESLGSDGRTYVGISPEAEPTDNIELRIETRLQFYGPYQPDVDPFQEVDPRIITNKAERLRYALGRARIVAKSEVWYFDVDRTTYPKDATGNKTRFEMSVVGHGTNSGLVETSG